MAIRLRQTLITRLCYSLSRIWALLDAKPAASAKLLPYARIVIIKPCCLGDVMLSTPVIATLREALPHAFLTYAVSRWARPALANNPQLNSILDTGFEGSHFNLYEYFNLIKILRQGKYDLALVLDRSPRLALLPWLAGIKKRAGLDSLGRGFALNYKATVEPGQPRHEAEIYLDVVRALGIEPNASPLEFYPGPEALASFKQKAQGWNLDLRRPLAVIHPGGGQNPDTQVLAKRWPAPYFGEIAARLLDQNLQVVLIGATGDREATQVVLAKATEKILETKRADQSLVDATGQLSIAETGALFQQAALFVGNDTGLMHIASACGPAVVAIFGPSSPAMYGPYTPKGLALSPLAAQVPEGLPLTEYQTLSVEEGGIAQIGVDRVWHAITQALQFEFTTATS